MLAVKRFISFLIQGFLASCVLDINASCEFSVMLICFSVTKDFYDSINNIFVGKTMQCRTSSVRASHSQRPWHPAPGVRLEAGRAPHTGAARGAGSARRVYVLPAFDCASNAGAAADAGCSAEGVSFTTLTLLMNNQFIKILVYGHTHCFFLSSEAPVDSTNDGTALVLLCTVLFQERAGTALTYKINTTWEQKILDTIRGVDGWTRYRVARAALR